MELVCKQPDPSVFYKTFLEFDGTNMVSILSFDGRSMEKLLSDEFAEHFSNKFPIIYRNKIQNGTVEKGNSVKKQYKYKNAIQNALENN